MKNTIYLFLALSFSIVSCKKKDDKGKTFAGINQTFRASTISLFEFSNLPAPRNIVYNALIPYQTETLVSKHSYQLTYANHALSSMQFSPSGIGGGHTMDYTVNANNLIIGSNAYGSRPNSTYTYDQRNRLISVNTSNISWEYKYNAQENLEQVILKDGSGIKKQEVLVTCDDKPNPLKGIPFSYIEEDVPIWTWFTLSSNNITSLQYTEYDVNGKVVDSSKYLFTYTYNENGQPLTQTRFYNDLKNFSAAFTYVYN